jgi:hypothetical protein
MKKILNYSILFAILFICTACPYESATPIDIPKFPIDENLIGKWEEKGKDKSDKGKNFYDMQKLDNQRYSLIENTLNENAETFTQKEFIAYISQVDGQNFLNIQAKKKLQTFMLYKIDFSADKKQLTLLPLSEYIREKFNNSKDLREFISTHKHLSFFYGQEMVLVKN